MIKVRFLGRGLAEYVAMFGLDPEKLRGKRILDCAAGASSFRSEMKGRGFSVTAVDPLYSRTPDELERLARENLEKHLISHPKFMVDAEKDFSDDRVRAYEMFIRDYREDPKGYICAELPYLPFGDGDFDLVVYANFLFLYEDLLNYKFHVESVREMLRVGREVRIFPVFNLHKGIRSRYLKGVVSALKEYDVRVEKVRHYRDAGFNEMLRIKWYII